MLIFLKAIFFLFIIIFISGCSQTIYSPPAKKFIKSEQILIKNYSLNTKQYAYVGAPIVKIKSYQQNKYTVNQLIVPNDLIISWNDGSKKVEYKLQKGKTLIIIGKIQHNDKMYNIAEFAQDSQYSYLFMLNPNDNSISKNFIFIRDLITFDNKVSTFNIKLSRNDISLENEEVEEVGDLRVGYINFELIFSGITKNSINVMYREYSSEDMARIAFYQNLVYSRTDDIIRFKDIIIKVYDVSNSQIIYSVIQDGLTQVSTN